MYYTKWCRNESEVKSKLIVQILLPSLGYTPNDWYQEVSFQQIRLDFLVIPIKFNRRKIKSKLSWCIIIEGKHPRENLELHLPQFKSYLNTFKVQYGLITNGKEIRIYQRQNQEIKLVLQCRGDELDNKIVRINNLIGKKSIRQKILSLDKHGSSIKSKNNRDKLSPEISSEKTIFPRTMKVIAIYHNKGGVGKTTTTVNLAAALAKKGLRILVIDLDSQANTTFALGLAKFTDETEDNLKNCHVYHLLRSNSKYFIPEVARKTSFSKYHIDAIPAHIDLMKYEKELFEIDAVKTRLRKKIDKVEELYDIVLIDTPPSLNLYARIALISTDYLIIPSDLKPFANEGLKNVENFILEINEFREDLGKKEINILGILPTKISTNARFIKHTFQKRKQVINERYSFPLFESTIYEREDVAKAVENVIIIGNLDIPEPRSVVDYKPNSLAAAEFEHLAREILDKIGLSK
jgi:cellulose biosynthesis protein BcsQ